MEEGQASQPLDGCRALFHNQGEEAVSRHEAWSQEKRVLQVSQEPPPAPQPRAVCQVKAEDSHH